MYLQNGWFDNDHITVTDLIRQDNLVLYLVNVEEDNRIELSPIHHKWDGVQDRFRTIAAYLPYFWSGWQALPLRPPASKAGRLLG